MIDFFRFLLVSLVFTLGTTNFSHAASFNCAKATTETEIAICNDPDLSALDELMSKLYSQALRSNDWRYFDEDKDDSELINSQRLAIKSQIQCGRNNACLLKFYRSRIFEILTTLGLNLEGQEFLKLLITLGLNLENYREDPLTSLLRFSPEITSKNSIRALAASNDGSVKVLIVSEGDPENISRANTGTVYDNNLIELIVSYTDSSGQTTQQVIEGPGSIALGSWLNVTAHNFSINQEHTRGFSETKYARFRNDKWGIAYENNRQVTRPGLGLIEDYTTDYQVGITYVKRSYVFLDCEILAQPRLLGDYSDFRNRANYRPFIDYNNTSETIENNVALNDFIDNLDDRVLREFSIFAFYDSDFELAKRGFEILASRNYAQSRDDLECVKSAILEKGQ